MCLRPKVIKHKRICSQSQHQTVSNKGIGYLTYFKMLLKKSKIIGSRYNFTSGIVLISTGMIWMKMGVNDNNFLFYQRSFLQFHS